jgi:hypothetical protein
VIGKCDYLLLNLETRAKLNKGRRGKWHYIHMYTLSFQSRPHKMQALYLQIEGGCYYASCMCKLHAQPENRSMALDDELNYISRIGQ